MHALARSVARTTERRAMHECEGAVEGVHEDHCTHDLPPDAQHAPGTVCCWCGDIFLPNSDSSEHGEYLPKVMTVPEPKKPKRKKRA